jgi:tryptophanyl-tRNA synthetase
MSLRDGSAKMSKSDPSEMARIHLTDSDDAIAQKFRKARTDPEPLPDTLAALEGRAEATNLVTIYAALAGKSPDAVVAEFAGQGFGAFKPALADLAIAVIGPIRDRFTRLLDDRGEIGRILSSGAAQAGERAAPILLEAQRAIGLQV